MDDGVQWGPFQVLLTFSQSEPHGGVTTRLVCLLSFKAFLRFRLRGMHRDGIVFVTLDEKTISILCMSNF